MIKIKKQRQKPNIAGGIGNMMYEVCKTENPV